MLLEFEGGIIDGETHDYPDGTAIEPALIFGFGKTNKLYEYRLVDFTPSVDEYTLEQKYRFRFHQVLPVGEKDCDIWYDRL